MVRAGGTVGAIGLAKGSVLMVDGRRRAAVGIGADGRTAIVAPGTPGPERGPQGTAMVGLLGAADAATLTVGVRWWPEKSELDSLVAAAARAHHVEPSRLRVDPESVTGVHASVRLVADGTETELVGGAASTVPPYVAVLAAQLAGPSIETVRRALFGQRGVLLVRCRGELAGNGCITGEVDVSEWTRAAPESHVVMLAG